MVFFASIPLNQVRSQLDNLKRQQQRPQEREKARERDLSTLTIVTCVRSRYCKWRASLPCPHHQRIFPRFRLFAGDHCRRSHEIICFSTAQIPGQSLQHVQPFERNKGSSRAKGKPRISKHVSHFQTGYTCSHPFPALWLLMCLIESTPP